MIQASCDWCPHMENIGLFKALGVFSIQLPKGGACRRRDDKEFVLSIQPAEESGTFKEICKQKQGILFLS